MIAGWARALLARATGPAMVYPKAAEASVAEAVAASCRHLVLAALGEVWEQNPHQRLCQLLVNVTDPPAGDPFYVTDEALIECLADYAPPRTA